MYIYIYIHTYILLYYDLVGGPGGPHCILYCITCYVLYYYWMAPGASSSYDHHNDSTHNETINSHNHIDMLNIITIAIAITITIASTIIRIYIYIYIHRLMAPEALLLLL